MNATLVQCPQCEAPLVVTNGEVQGLITFWMRDGYPCATPHDEDCPLAGKETPS